jgi:hypothetical protein
MVRVYNSRLYFGYAIAHALNLPVNIQYDLLLATDKTLIEKLHQILTEVNLSF